MPSFYAWRDQPKRGETDAEWCATREVDGHVRQIVAGCRTKTAALLAVGAPLKTYDVEVYARDLRAHGMFEVRWVREVPCYEMSSEAALDGVHEATDFTMNVNHVRAVRATTATQSGELT